LVGLSVLWGEAWDGVAETCSIELSVFLDRSGEKTLAKRTKWNKSDPEFSSVGRISSSGSLQQSEYSPWSAATG